MKFGKIFLFPDPDSRLSHEPLKLVTLQSEPLVQDAEMSYLHVLSKSYRGNVLKVVKIWAQEGERYAKAISFDKGWGPLALVLRQRAVARSWARFRVRELTLLKLPMREREFA